MGRRLAPRNHFDGNQTLVTQGYGVTRTTGVMARSPVWVFSASNWASRLKFAWSARPHPSARNNIRC